MSSEYNNLLQKFENNVPIILDSGVSTELERRGAPMRKGQWSACVAIDAFETLVETHLAYIEAGADIITVNSYASSRLMLEPAGLGDQVQNINERNVDAALEARSRSGKPIAIAGSLSHALPFIDGFEGAFQQPIIPSEQLIRSYKEMITIMEVKGVDLLLLEMMSIPSRMEPLFVYASSSDLPVWCGLSAKREAIGSPLKSWHDDTVAFEEIIALANNYSFEGMGIMHTSVDTVEFALKQINEEFKGIVMAYPDSGYFAAPNWQFQDIITPPDLLDFARKWTVIGCGVFGGCCGLGPEHTKKLCELRS